MTKVIACDVPLPTAPCLCFTPLYCSFLLKFKFYFMYPWSTLPTVKELDPMKVLELLGAQNSATFPGLSLRAEPLRYQSCITDTPDLVTIIYMTNESYTITASLQGVRVCTVSLGITSPRMPGMGAISPHSIFCYSTSLSPSFPLVCRCVLASWIRFISLKYMRHNLSTVTYAHIYLLY